MTDPDLVDPGKVRTVAHAPRLEYRPELDAIRGLAILLVLLQHFLFIGAGPARLAAPGMVGVTLFFVLSGYLITSLLVAERAKTGRVSLGAFYKRRARRLVPALVVLVGVAALFGWPGSPLFALAYLGNWTDALHVPMGFLTHTWTLGIEEQFYLVWPLVFIALIRWPKALAGVLVAAALLSVIFRHEIGITMRADALGAGCLLALYGKPLPRWTAWVGWPAVIACSLIPGEQDWIWTVAALASTLAVGSGRFVASRPLVWLGSISYALYLWHYPVASLLNPITVLLGPAGFLTGMVVGIAISLAIAMFSTRFIEARFRRSPIHLRLPDVHWDGRDKERGLDAVGVARV